MYFSQVKSQPRNVRLRDAENLADQDLQLSSECLMQDVAI